MTANHIQGASALSSAFEEILDKARRSPSGVNTQPWQVIVVGRKTLGELARLVEQRATPSLRDRLHGMEAALFALCIIDERLGLGSELDYGMFLQNIRLLAAARGLEASVWPAWSAATDMVCELMPMPEHRVLCALTLDRASEQQSETARASGVQVRWVE